MEEKHIPLLAKTSCLRIANIMDSFPNLIVVAMAQGPHSLERYLRPIVERYPNFYIDTASYMVDGLIESHCERYGSGGCCLGPATRTIAAARPCSVWRRRTSLIRTEQL